MSNLTLAECPKHGAYMAHQGACPVCGGESLSKVDMQKQSEPLPTSLKIISEHEESLFSYILLHGIEKPMRQYRFMEDRQYPFDFAWPQYKLAVEIDGGEYMERGGHTWGKGFVRDREKQNAAVLLGWHILRFTGSHVQDNPHYCIETIKALLDKLVQ